MTPAEAKEIRVNLGMTQTQLAKELSVRQATVSDNERGVTRITALYALALRYVASQHTPKRAKKEKKGNRQASSVSG